jgi:two-component system nitrogen regulation response regulator NtrX
LDKCLSHTISLLLIDDDSFLLHAFSDMLAFNFPRVLVTAVDSGMAAVEQVRKQEYDMVICDLMMPGMDGAMTIEKIRKDHPSLRVYMMTGHPEPEQVYKATQATGFIKKPLDREWFLDFMRRTLQVISAHKSVVERVVQVNECLSSSMKHQADVEVLLRAAKVQVKRGYPG